MYIYRLHSNNCNTICYYETLAGAIEAARAAMLARIASIVGPTVGFSTVPTDDQVFVGTDEFVLSPAYRIVRLSVGS